MDASTTAELMIRMIVGLALVLGLLVLGTKLARQRLGRTTSVDIDVCGRQVLSKASSIAVVRVGGRHLLLGVNDNGVSLLAEGDDLLEAPAPTTTTPAATPSVTTPAPTPSPVRRPAVAGPAPTPGTDGTEADGPSEETVVDIRSAVLETLRQKTLRRT